MPLLRDLELETNLAKLSGWQLLPETSDQPAKIQKVYKTGSFVTGLNFVNRVADLAEKQNHHPDVLLTYPKVTLTLTTHDSGGLTDKDIQLAREIDNLGVATVG